MRLISCHTRVLFGVITTRMRESSHWRQRILTLIVDFSQVVLLFRFIFSDVQVFLTVGNGRENLLSSLPNLYSGEQER